MAPSTKPAGAPQICATPPAKSPPIGAEPAKTVTYSDITRPRRWSGTPYCTVTLMVLIMSIELRPMKITQM